MGLDAPTISTLHGFCLRQLLRNASIPELPFPILIADDYDERWLIQEDLKLILSRSVRQVQHAFQDLASDWETLAADSEDWEQNYPDPAFIGALREHRAVFGYTLRGELVYRVKRALLERPDFDLEGEFTHVLVDEYQDLNRCELAVVEAFSLRGASLYVAGDDDQSIYGFRHAFPQGIRDFPNTYRGAVDKELEICHRCDREILRLALAVAAQDPRRVEKNLRVPDQAEDGTVKILGFMSATAEAQGVARLCRYLVNQCAVPPKDILILLRRDAHAAFSTPIIQELERLGLRGQLVINPFAVLEDAEGRQIVCILRLLADRRDSLAWRELLELRTNGVGPGTLKAVYTSAREEGRRFAQVLEQIKDDSPSPSIANRLRLQADLRAIDALLDALEPLLDEPAEDALPSLLSSVLGGDEAPDLLGALLALAIEEGGALRSVLEGLQSVRDYAEQLVREGEEDSIRFMSMHSAKGLTAHAVIIPAAEDELLPGDPEDERQEGDERRLLYVSLTRAQHYLFVTYSASRTGYQARAGRASPQHGLTRFLRQVSNPQAGISYLSSIEA